MQIEFKPTEPRNTNMNSILSNRFKSFIHHNKINKILKRAGHPIEIISSRDWQGIKWLQANLDHSKVV